MNVFDAIDKLHADLTAKPSPSKPKPQARKRNRRHEPMEWEVMEQEWMQKRIGKRRANRLRNQPVLVAKTKPGHAYERLTKEHA